VARQRARLRDLKPRNLGTTPDSPNAATPKPPRRRDLLVCPSPPDTKRTMRSSAGFLSRYWRDLTAPSLSEPEAACPAGPRNQAPPDSEATTGVAAPFASERRNKIFVTRLDALAIERAMHWHTIGAVRRPPGFIEASATSTPRCNWQGRKILRPFAFPPISYAGACCSPSAGGGSATGSAGAATGSDRARHADRPEQAPKEALMPPRDRHPPGLRDR
jgi:hypothetical protein